MQQIQIIGYLGKDCEKVNTPHNTYLRFSVAVTEKKDEPATWYYVMTKTLSIEEYLKKGTKVFVQGALAAKIFESEKGAIVNLTIRSAAVTLISTPQAQQD